MHQNSENGTKDADGYQVMMERINWFFFDLFILGYVEDVNSGESFHFTPCKWSIYVEVIVFVNSKN